MSSLWTVGPVALRHPFANHVGAWDVVNLDWKHQPMDEGVTGSMARGYMEDRMGATYISDIGSTVASLAEGPVLASCTATAHPQRAETGWRVLGRGRIKRVASMLGLRMFDLSPSCAGSWDGGRGGVVPASPRRRDPPRALDRVARRADGEDAVHRRAACRRGRHLRDGHAEVDEPQSSLGAGRWVMPWERPPPWLYLPHLGATTGHETADEAKARPEEPGTPLGRSRGADVGDDHLGGVGDYVPGARHERQGACDGQHVDPRTHGAHAIRGPDRAPGAQRGTRAGSGDQQRIEDPIRGQELLPGADFGGQRQRAQDRVAARLSHLRQSIDDHAERVALKRAREGDRPAGPSAAARLEALRRRVTDRAGARGALPAQATCSTDVQHDTVATAAAAHAATRAAQHALDVAHAAVEQQLSA